MRTYPITVWSAFLLFLALPCAVLAQQQSNDNPSRSIAIKVIDQATSQPIPDASIRVFWTGHEETVGVDANGMHTLALPADHGFLVLVADAPQYASVRAGFHNRRGRPTPVPAAQTLALAKGRAIGGRVIDEDGQGIAGVAMSIHGSAVWDGKSTINQQFSDKSIVTDADGHWSYDRAPSDLGSLTVEINHPGYVRLVEHHASVAQGDRPASSLLAALGDMTGTITLLRGIEVGGTIVDPDGKSVANAIVSAPSQQYGPVQELTRANDRGKWSLRRLPGPVLLCFEAENLAPLRREVTIAPDMQPMDVQLPRGWPLRGRVVDPQGRPRENIRVSVETIGGDRMRRYPVEWSGKTDADGRFEWRNAPDDAFTLGLYGNDKVMRLSDVPVARSDDEITFIMYEALRFAGKVTDAVTGRPITKFTVIPGMGWSGSMRLGRESAQAHESTDGSYTYAVDFPRESHCLVFEADGYAPFQSGAYHNEDGAQTLDVALQPAAAITGTVARADGQPVEQARVYVGTSASPVTIEGSKSSPPPNEGFFVEVDADGRFAIPHQVSNFAVVALNDYGVARALDSNLEGDRPLVLQPWSRVEVEVLDRGAPVEGRRVSIDGMYDPHDPMRVIYFHNSGETDADGRCMFTHIPPGQWRAMEWEPTGEHSSRSDRFVIVDVKPGEERRVATRQGGVRVVGRAVVPEGAQIDGSLSAAKVFIHSQRQPPLPDNWADMKPEERAKWQEDWQKSDAGRRHARDAFLNDRYYFASLDDEGAFAIEGVAPGAYRLRIEGEDSAQPGVAILCRTIKEHDILIPAEEARVDIGEFELEALTRLRIGDEAPAFAITTLDGGPLNLSDFRGKYVFLDFWATWCGPCKAEIPHLKALHEAMKNRNDFVIISLSLDNDAAIPAQYVKDHGMTWTHGFLGKWSDDVVTKAYGVRGIPATFLIGPDGRVVLSNVRGAEAVAAVRRAIESPSPR